jgi:hypothetical protein
MGWGRCGRAGGGLIPFPPAAAKEAGEEEAGVADAKLCVLTCLQKKYRTTNNRQEISTQKQSWNEVETKGGSSTLTSSKCPLGRMTWNTQGARI